jgi:hypothetical protein
VKKTRLVGMAAEWTEAIKVLTMYCGERITLN